MAKKKEPVVVNTTPPRDPYTLAIEARRAKQLQTLGTHTVGTATEVTASTVVEPPKEVEIEDEE